MKIVKPFLEVIRTEETSGLITGECLSSLQKFLMHGFFTLNSCNGISALGEIAEAISHCRFEATDSGKDEIVLSKLLSVQSACLDCECGAYLSDHVVWDMFQTSLRIYYQMKPPDYSDLLSYSAQRSLLELVRTVFAKLKYHDQSSEGEHSKSAELFHHTNIEYTQQFFGIPCMVKVFGALCSWAARGVDNLDEEFFDTSHKSISTLTNSSSSHSNGLSPMNLLILRLILAALDESGYFFTKIPALMALISDDVCALLLRLSRVDNSETLCLILRIFYNVIALGRNNFKMQIEVIFNSIYMRLASQGSGPKFGDHSKASVRLTYQAVPQKHSNESTSRRVSFSRDVDDISDETAMILLDGIVALCKIPWFCREIYSNYDCDPRCTNVFHNLVRIVCQYAFPINGSIITKHYIALDALRWIIFNLDVEIIVESKVDDVVTKNLLEQKKHKEVLSEAIEIFNEKPKKGIERMIECNIITSEDNAMAIAELLRYHFGFSKSKIGEFIGDGDSLSGKVRKHFMEMFDFRNRSIDEALRISFESFRLPKEAQQIDRILQAFSNHYFEQNRTIFANADAVHLLTFSLLMLHTVSSMMLYSTIMSKIAKFFVGCMEQES